MINGKTILAVIPARGGSKGLPHKNIKTLLGKPLIAWTIEEAKKSQFIDRLILSSEEKLIIDIAKELGCEVPFIRPKRLATDMTPQIDVAIHAINMLSVKYDFICWLQPTSPLRKVEHIDICIEKCINNNAESLVSVSKVDKHPYWMYKRKDNSQLVQLFPEINNEIRRQDLPEVLCLNGAVYMASVQQIKEKKRFVTEKTICHIMDRKDSIDIDEQFDFEIAKMLLTDLK